MHMYTNPRRRLHTAGLASVLMFAAAGCASAGSVPDSERGRYSFSSTADGVLRLDVQTGSISTCSNPGAGWVCRMVPDERAALDTEIGRLQADNEKLKAELANRDLAPSGSKIGEPFAKGDSERSGPGKQAERNKIEVPLPDDRDVDRVIAFVERAWRRLLDMADRMQRDVSGKI